MITVKTIDDNKSRIVTGKDKTAARIHLANETPNVEDISLQLFAKTLTTEIDLKSHLFK